MDRLRGTANQHNQKRYDTICHLHDVRSDDVGGLAYVSEGILEWFRVPVCSGERGTYGNDFRDIS